MRKNSPLNNNRNNNRRRGRGNNNRNQSGGGNQLNRIDSRARGNAPQLLDKYKKLAQDAQHNGDRVQAEYYLQFADHYQRVIADNKALQDEARAKRNEGRGDDRGDDRGDRGDRSDSRNDDREARDDDGRQDNRARRPRSRNDRNDNRRDHREEGRVADQHEGELGSEGDAAVEAAPKGSEDDAPEKVAKPRRARKERAAPRAKKEAGDEAKPRAKKAADGEVKSRAPRAVRTPRKKPASDGAIDAGILPPAISSEGDIEAAE